MIVIVIPAKAQSSRLPNKNMVKINGRPMLDYTIDEAKASARNLPIYVSTDGDEVSVVVGLQVDHPDRNVGIDETLDRFEEESADRLMSTEADGTKNGAHYVLSRHFVDCGESRKDIVIIDDCTNIHFAEEVERAAARLAARENRPL